MSTVGSGSAAPGACNVKRTDRSGRPTYRCRLGRNEPRRTRRRSVVCDTSYPAPSGSQHFASGPLVRKSNVVREDEVSAGERPPGRLMDVFSGGGRVGRDLARVKWEATPLGPWRGWPQSLTSAVSTVLRSRFSMWMAWGPELTFFCNDAYRRDTLGPSTRGHSGAPRARCGPRSGRRSAPASST